MPRSPAPVPRSGADRMAASPLDAFAIAATEKKRGLKPEGLRPEAEAPAAWGCRRRKTGLGRRRPGASRVSSDQPLNISCSWPRCRSRPARIEPEDDVVALATEKVLVM